MIYVSLWNFNTSQYPFFHWTSWRTETLYINCISVEEGGTVNLRKFRVLHVYIHVQKNINDIREQTSLANIHRIWMKNSRLNGNCRWFVINEQIKIKNIGKDLCYPDLQFVFSDASISFKELRRDFCSYNQKALRKPRWWIIDGNALYMFLYI